MNFRRTRDAWLGVIIFAIVYGRKQAAKVEAPWPTHASVVAAA